MLICLPYSSPEDETICHAGKAYGTLFSLWKKFFTILADGPDLVKIANPSYLSERSVTHHHHVNSTMT